MKLRIDRQYHSSVYTDPCTDAGTCTSLRSCPWPQISSLVWLVPFLTSSLRTTSNFVPDGEGTTRAAPLSSNGNGAQRQFLTFPDSTSGINTVDMNIRVALAEIFIWLMVTITSNPSSPVYFPFTQKLTEDKDYTQKIYKNWSLLNVLHSRYWIVVWVAKENST